LRASGEYFTSGRLPKPYTGDAAISLGPRSYLRAEYVAQSLAYAFERFLSLPTTMASDDLQLILRQHLQSRLKECQKKLLSTPHDQPAFYFDESDFAPDHNDLARFPGRFFTPHSRHSCY
jgi:hypothetical protein